MRDGNRQSILFSDTVSRRVEVCFEEPLAASDGGAVCETMAFAGMTDFAIVREGLRQLGRSADHALVPLLLEDYLGFLDEELLAPPGVRVLPGIESALAAAEKLPHVAIGLGTGNLHAGARKKLKRAGLWDRFPFGGFADDSERRAELIATGARRGAARLNAPLEECRVVVIGDTPLDVAAAHANKFEAFAVATGPVKIEELESARPERLFANLEADGALVALLEGE